MSWICRGMGLALLLAAVPVLAQDKGGRKPAQQPSQDLTPLVLAGEAVGRIGRIHSGASFTLEVALPNPQPAPLRPGKGRPASRLIKKQFILETADDVQVRVMQLPPQFDDKGKPKKYTPEEVRELRGTNPNLPGFKSDLDSLKVGQIVKVFFRRFQPASPPLNPGDEKDKDKKTELDNTPRVALIVIVSEGDSVAAAARKASMEKKKK